MIIVYVCLPIAIAILVGYIYYLGKANGKLREQVKNQNNAIKEVVDVKKDIEKRRHDDIDTVCDRLRKTAIDN